MKMREIVDMEHMLIRWGVRYDEESQQYNIVTEEDGDPWVIASIPLALPVGHSRKPEAVQDALERLFPDGPRLELFARRPRFGWTVWGNEVPCKANPVAHQTDSPQHTAPQQ
jgi:hypothetical protein